MTVDRLAVEPAAGLAEQPEGQEQLLDPERVQQPGADAVGREQIDPGQHPHQVVDPERQDQREQDDALPAPGVTGREVRHRVADQEREADRDDDELDRAERDREVLVAVPQVLEHLEDVADVPVQRVPVRNRVRERVLVAERDGHHRVERREEEDRQPRDAGQREQAPRPARCPSTSLELRPGVVPVLLALDAQLQQFLVRGELVGPDDRLLQRVRDGARLDQRLRVDVLLRRRVPGVVDEVV